MKKLILAALLLSITACGKHIKTIEYVDNTNSINELNDRLNETEEQLDTIQDKIEALENAGMHVKELIDPCGDQANQYNEVLIKLSTGQLVAFFEGSNNKRFLTILNDGQYITTDKQACRFDVVQGEVVLK